MRKTKACILIAMLMLALSGCTGAEQEQLTVYSFRGENEMLSVSNGVIVLGGTEEIFAGGDMEMDSGSLTDITSYVTKFYVLSDGEEKVISFSGAEDKTGGTLRMPGNLGRLSGAGVISRVGAEDLKNNLYFELTVADKKGRKHVYRLPLSVKEITGTSGD